MEEDVYVLHICKQTYKDTSIYVSVCEWVRVFRNTFWKYTYIYIYIYIYMIIYRYIYIYIYIYISKNTFINTHTHKYISLGAYS